MKNTRVIARILAWFNMIFWGIPIISAILQSFVAPNLPILVMLVLLAAIPLHSYAALQLLKSIRNPEVRLSHNTPVGIRFVGLVALFFGILLTGCGAVILQGAKEMLPLFKEQMSAYKEIDPSMLTVGVLQKYGVFMMLLGLAIIVGVILDLRLLRWYYLVRQSDIN